MPKLCLKWSHERRRLAHALTCDNVIVCKDWTQDIGARRAFATWKQRPRPVCVMRVQRRSIDSAAEARYQINQSKPTTIQPFSQQFRRLANGTKVHKGPWLGTDLIKDKKRATIGLEA